MKINNTKIISIIATAIVSLFWMNPTFAAHPPSIAGNWAAVGNQTLGNLVINQPASAATCKPITGTIFGSPIIGKYCPAVGHVVFVRLTATVTQAYDAYVSRDAAVDRMGGTFFDGNALANEGVNFNFSATK